MHQNAGFTLTLKVQLLKYNFFSVFPLFQQTEYSEVLWYLMDIMRWFKELLFADILEAYQLLNEEIVISRSPINGL